MTKDPARERVEGFEDVGVRVGVVLAEVNGETSGSFGVIGRDDCEPAAFASRYSMRDASALISFSNDLFSIVSGPGNETLLAFERFNAARPENESSAERLYCFARLDRIPESAMCMSWSAMMG